MGPFGEIQTIVSNGGLTVTNVTQRLHVFYDGQAVRTVFQVRDGAWYVKTHSYGNNMYGTAGINQLWGPDIFDTLDQQMLSNIEAHH
jgi:hypothetical protein